MTIISDVPKISSLYSSGCKYLNAKHYLIWTLIEKYKNEGYEKFNLGGVPGFNAKNNDYDGLRQFKLNFGAKVIEYAGDFTLVTTKKLFSKKQALKNSVKYY